MFSVLVHFIQVWPVAQAVNFTFVPMDHRLLFANVVALCWNTYLAWRSEKRVPPPQ